MKLHTQIFFKSQPVSFNFIKVYRFLKEVDVVHLHTPYPTMELMLGVLLILFKNKKILITYHANPNKTRWKWVYKLFLPYLKILLKRSNLILVTSKHNLENSNIPKRYWGKVKILPIGTDFESGDIGNKPKQLPKQRIKLLFVGRLREYKGIYILLEAIKNIDIELTIIGDGEEKPKLQKFIKDNYMGNRVFIHSNISDIELVNFYKSSDVFVLPSINESETFGIVQIEAMKYGLPVLNTRLKSGVPEVSIDNLTGITVEPSSAPKLLDAIIRISNDPELYFKFSKNALERSKFYSNDKIKREYRNIILGLIHDNNI